MGRAPCCDKANVKRGPWSPEEDAKLKSYIENHGTGGNWIALPQKIGLKRCGKSCRLRWLNYLRPNIKHGGFTEDEDNLICSLYISIGSRWSIIAAQLPGRTDNDIKNYWNTRLKKKLLGKQRRSHPSHPNLSLFNHLQPPPLFQTQPSNPIISMMVPPLQPPLPLCNRLQTMRVGLDTSPGLNFLSVQDQFYEPLRGDYRATDEIYEMDEIENLFDINCAGYPPALSDYEILQRKTLQNWEFFDQQRILGYSE